jgi:PAS domain S-box-containing protein
MEELAHAMEALSHPVFVLTAVRDADGTVAELTYAFVNEAAARLYGMSVEEVVGHGQLELFGSVSELGIWDGYLEVLRSGSPGSFDVPWLREEGVEGSFRLAVSRFGDGLLISVHDITDRHLAERRLRAAYDSMIDPHVLYEAIRDESGEIVDFSFVDANPAACEYNRWDREQLIGSTLLEQWPDFAHDPTREAYAQVLATGEPIMLDDAGWAQERLFGGQIRHYDLRAVRVSESLLSVTWRDITERYAKTEHDQRMAVIVERSHDAIIGTVLPDAAIVSWNPAAEQMYGYTAEEVIGRPAYLLAPLDEKARTHAFADALAAGESIPDFETVRLRKDASQVQVSISTSTICNDDGKVTGFVSFHRDITQQAESRRELAAQQAGEQKRLAELEQFQRLTVGRELKMIELKKEIEYLRKSGPPSPADPAGEG